jgi:hypothetical protein
MKIKTLLAALLVAAATASVALAKPPEKGAPGQSGEHGKSAKTERGEHGKKPGTADCAGKRAKLEFQGTIASVGADSIALTVKQANGHARQLKGTQVTVQVDEKTRIRRNGHAKLADLQTGDRAHVHAWGCRAAATTTAPADGSTAAPAPQKIVAVKIDAHPAKAESGDDSETEPTTTTAP